MSAESNANAETSVKEMQIPIRIAVLGGGPSALTALYHMTSLPNSERDYEFTVYQMGWRLGGKGASGRSEHGRIDEHGLHILFGFYDNFFAMIRSCYDELERDTEASLATWCQAFKPHSFGVVEEQFKGEWRHWPLEFQTNDILPGDAGSWDDSADYLSMFVRSMIEFLFGRKAFEDSPNGVNATGPKKSWFYPVTSVFMRSLIYILERSLRKSIEKTDRNARFRSLLRATGLFNWFWSIAQRSSGISFAMHRFWLGCDFLMAVVRGIISDEVYKDGGFDRIDNYDFREWLLKHGIHEVTLPSPYCRTIYDAAFSYRNGDPEDQQIAAGAALRALFRMGFTYKGSAYYKMQAGMGETVFTPLYEILKKRGVKFKFFHKVEALHLSEVPDDGSERFIKSISIRQQAIVSGKDPEHYSPLVNVGGLDCWPSKPLYDQLENAEELERYDLESYYDNLPTPMTNDLTIEMGKDFDKVLYAIPIGAVPYVCEELVEDNPRWKDMVDHVKSVTTVAFQLWFSKDLDQMGWKMPKPLLSLYEQPYNTWSDMSQVMWSESWPNDHQPKSISYYCGAYFGDDIAPDPRLEENSGFEKDEFQKAKALGIEYCEKHLPKMMPNSTNSATPPAFDWSTLVDPQNNEGPLRFDAQYWRSNCGPTDRCTLALPGSTKYRMKSGDTGYSNLVVTGDWTENGLYVACIEGAVCSGIYAARALTGYNFPVLGEHLNNMQTNLSTNLER